MTRFGIEHFRGDEIRGVWIAGLSTSQLISIVGGTLALVLLWRLRGFRDPAPGSPASAVDDLRP